MSNHTQATPSPTTGSSGGAAAGTSAPPLAPAVPAAQVAQYQTLLASLQGNLAARNMALTLQDPASRGSRLDAAFDADRTAYLQLLNRSTPATTAELDAAWTRLQASHARLIQWLEDAIPRRFHGDFIKFLGWGMPLRSSAAPVAPVVITAQQVTEFTEPQLQALGPGLANLTDDALRALTPAHVGWMTGPQVTALSGTSLLKLKPETLSEIIATKFAFLSADGIAALVRTTPRRLDATHLVRITPGQAEALTKEDMTALGSLVGSLSEEVLRRLRADQVSGMSLSALSAEQLGWISAASLVQVTSQQVSSLSEEKMQALGEDVSALPPGAIRGLILNRMSMDQLAALTEVQVRELDASQMGAAREDKLKALGVSVAWLTAQAVANLNLHDLSDGQLQALQPQQLTSVTSTKLRLVSPAQFRLMQVSVSGLPPAALQNLTTDQAQNLSPEQVNALGAKVANLPLDMALALVQRLPAAVSPEGVAALFPNRGTFNETQRTTFANFVASWTPLQVSLLTQSQLTNLGVAAQRLNQGALQGLSTTQASWLPLHMLLDTQIPWLLTQQVQGLTRQQLADLQDSTPTSAPSRLHLLGTTVSVLEPSALAGIRLARLSTEQRAVLQKEQMSQLGAESLTGITAAVLKELRGSIAGIPSPLLFAMDDPLWSQITPDQVQALDGKFAELKTTAIDSVLSRPPDATMGSFLDSVTAAAVAGLVRTRLSTLTSTRLAAMKAPQFSQLTAPDLTTLGDRVQHFNRETIESLTQAQIPGVAFQHLTPTQLGWLTANQLGWASADQIGQLTTSAKVQALGTDVSGLRSEAVARLNLSHMTTTQLAALKREQLASVGLAGVTSLTFEQTDALGADLAGLPTAVLHDLLNRTMRPSLGDFYGAITRASDATLGAIGTWIARLDSYPLAIPTLLTSKFSQLSSESLRALLRETSRLNDATHVAKLTAAQLSTFEASDFARLDGLVPQLKVETLEALPPEQIGYLKLDALTQTQLETLTPAWFSKVPAAAVTKFTASQIAQIKTKLASFSNEAMGALTVAQVASTTPEQVQGLGAKLRFLSPEVTAELFRLHRQTMSSYAPSAFNPAALPLLPSDLIRSWSASDVASFTGEHVTSLGDGFQQIRPSAISGLSPSALREKPLHQMTLAQLGMMSQVQLSGVTQEEVALLSDGQLQALGAGISGLPPDAMPGVRLNALTTEQLLALNPSQWAAVETEQVNALDPQRFPRLGSKIRYLSATVIRDLSIPLVDAMTPSQVKSLGDRIAFLRDEALESLYRDSAKVAAITAQGMRALSAAQIALGPVYAFSPSQLGALDRRHLSAVGPEAARMLTERQLKSLGAAISGLDPSAISEVNLSACTNNQLVALEPRHVAAITADQVLALSPRQVASLGADIRAMDIETLAALSSEQIRALTPAQFTALGAKVVHLQFEPPQLTRTQARAIPAEGRAALTEAGRPLAS